MRTGQVVYGGGVEARSGKLERLYAIHIEDATKLAYLLTGDGHLAEDLAQDAFVRAAGRFVHLRAESSFTGYLMRSVVNACRSHWRRRKLEQAYLERVQRERPAPSHESDFADRQDIAGALGALTPRQRMAVVLRHYRDLSEQQTAELMGCSVGTVKSLTSRGLRILRDQMEGAPR